MYNTSVSEAINRMGEAHNSLICLTSVIDILKNLDPSGYENTVVLAGDISNTLGIVSEKLSEQLGIIETSILDIEGAFDEK
ncbi:MAG: hypothetical protein MJ097_02205 [Dorea sp.]|nr:hypothetical protein [Dorea sp.]